LLDALAARKDGVATSAKAWLAVAYLTEGEVDAAIVHAEAALADDRREPVASLALAVALEAKGDPSASAWRARVRDLASPRR
jgi:Tfp pilus assembly protein PilF